MLDKRIEPSQRRIEQALQSLGRWSDRDRRGRWAWPHMRMSALESLVTALNYHVTLLESIAIPDERQRTRLALPSEQESDGPFRAGDRVRLVADLLMRWGDQVIALAGTCGAADTGEVNREGEMFVHFPDPIGGRWAPVTALENLETRKGSSDAASTETT